MIKFKKNKKIFICCTEQSGENIAYNICKKLKKYNYQIDGVCGKSSQDYFTIKYYDISLFKSLGLIEILLSTETFYCLNSGSHCLAAVLKKNYGYPKKIVSYLPNLELTDLYSFGHVYENVDYLSTPGLKNDNISMPRKMRIYTGLIKKYFNDTDNL